MRDYHLNIFNSREYGGHVADIPYLELCSAFGDAPEVALKAVREAQAAWLTDAREAGRPVPPPRDQPAIYEPAD